MASNNYVVQNTSYLALLWFRVVPPRSRLRSPVVFRRTPQSTGTLLNTILRYRFRGRSKTERWRCTVVELSWDVEVRVADDADTESNLFDVGGRLVSVRLLEAAQVEERRDVLGQYSRRQRRHQPHDRQTRTCPCRHIGSLASVADEPARRTRATDRG